MHEHISFAVLAHDKNQTLCQWRKQTTSDVWVEAFLDLADMPKPMVWAEEDGQIIKSVGPFIDRRSQERCSRRRWGHASECHVDLRC